MLTELEALAEQIKQPIEGGDPYGEDPKYEDRFSELKEEIAKMGGMGAGATDWEKVTQLSQDMLRENAKDLNLTAYMITAWTQRFQLPGMVVGLEILAHFCGEPWLEIFPKPMPKRKKARVLTLGWLQTQLGDRLDTCESRDRGLLERGIAVCDQLKDAVYEHFEDPPANFKNVRKTLEGWLALLPEDQGEPASQPEAEPEAGSGAPEGETSPQTPARSTPRAKIEAPSLAEDADSEALYEALDQIAAQLGALSPLDPTPFLLRRTALWDGASMPNHDDSRETFFPAPPDELTESLKNMLSRSAWEPLLEKVEDLMRQRWYWLDLQYYAVQAARGLEAEALVRLIEERVYGFDQRLPDLKELKFNDGTPFAGPTTKDWLAHITVGEAGGGAGEADAAQALLSAMRQRGVEGFAEAMVDAQQAIAGAANGRDAFRMRLEAARFCIEAEQFYWAESLGEAMVADIETHQLAAWEPELAAGAWVILLEVARELKSSEDGYLPLERRAMLALAKLDLARIGGYPKNKPVY